MSVGVYGLDTLEETAAVVAAGDCHRIHWDALASWHRPFRPQGPWENSVVGFAHIRLGNRALDWPECESASAVSQRVRSLPRVPPSYLVARC